MIKQKNSNPQFPKMFDICKRTPRLRKWSKQCEPRFQYLGEITVSRLGFSFKVIHAEARFGDSISRDILRSWLPVLWCLSCTEILGDQVGEFRIAHGSNMGLKWSKTFRPSSLGGQAFRIQEKLAVPDEIQLGPGVKNCRPSALGACGTGVEIQDHPWLLRDGEAGRQDNIPSIRR